MRVIVGGWVGCGMCVGWVGGLDSTVNDHKNWGACDLISFNFNG